MKNALKNKPEITFEIPETPQAQNVMVEATKADLVIKTPARYAVSPSFFIAVSFLGLWFFAGFGIVNGFPSDIILATYTTGLMVGLCVLLYLLIATFINKTVLTLTPDTLTIEQKPLPVGFRTKRYAVSDIKSIKVATRFFVSAHRTRRFYAVQLVLHKGWNRKKNLVGGFKRPTEPTHIVEMMQEFLS